MKQGKVAVHKIMEFKENETFYLKENVKGRAESSCAFVCSFGDDAVQFSFDVEDDHIVSPFAEDNPSIISLSAFCEPPSRILLSHVMQPKRRNCAPLNCSSSPSL